MDPEKDEVMIEEPGEESPEVKKSSKKGLGKKMLILLGVIILLLGAGGYVGYSMLFQEKNKEAKIVQKENKEKEKMILLALDPFILNLSDPGRHLKVTVQFELNNEKDELKVKERTPKLRDIIIMLLSSKTVDSVSSPEGKFQIKDEILLRANQAMDREVFRNVYFTDFVMQ
jgi:flagellar protein FliL